MGLFSNIFGQNKYPEEWNFYLTNIDDQPASININLGLYKFIPIKDKSELCRVVVKLQNPSENGLSTNDESEILFNIEDFILNKINQKNTIYIGRITNNGYRDFFFYSKNSETFKNELNGISKYFKNYNFKINTKEDKDWEAYLNIYPNALNFQTMSNRDVLENLEKNGDSLTIEREVFHWIYFKSENDRSKFILLVKEKRFEIVEEVFNTEDEYPYSLQIKRVDKVGYEDIDHYTLSLWVLANENNGIYDGWETSVEND